MDVGVLGGGGRSRRFLEMCIRDRLDTSKDQLIVATNAAFEPFEYTKGDSYLGIDMEIAAMLAEELGMELVVQNMDFDAV